MAARSPKDNTISLTFGAGINARQRAADVSKFECVRGENFDLDGASGAFRRRNAFSLVTTAPNGQAIRGYAQLIKRDGTISTLIQAGNTVYQWNGNQTFTQVGTCHGSSRLRGPRRHNWLLDQFVVITDLEKLTPVQMWDGTTYQALPHDLGGDMYAKHCNVHNERIILGNVTTAGVDTPHVLLACKQSAPYNWSDSDRPSSALGTDAPFYLIVPNFRPINALIDAFGSDIVSTFRDRLFVLSGTSAKDFAFQEFYAGSAIAGDEAWANVGNDVFMGRRGRIESLRGTLNFGDVEANDVSFQLKPLVEHVHEWTIAYEQRTQRVFCFPSSQNCVYVYHKTLADTAQGMSPWSKWTTTHSLGFHPETIMPMMNSADTTDDNIADDMLFMGDTIGNIYLIDGSRSTDGAYNQMALVLGQQATPFLSAYRWSEVGFGTAYSNPSTLPPNFTNGMGVSPDGDAVAFAHNTSPFITVYPWTGAGFGTKYTNPTTALPGFGNRVAFSPDGTAIAIAHNGGTTLSVYAWSSAGFGSKFSDPVSALSSSANSVAFSPAGDAIAVAIGGSPWIEVYAWSSAGFGAKFSNPASLPPNFGNGVAFSPDGDAIAVTHNTSPYVTAYAWSTSGFGAIYSAPATTPTGAGVDVGFSPDGGALVVVHNTTPFVTAYPWSAASGFGTKFTNPTTLPAGVGQGVGFTRDSQTIAIAHRNKPDVSAYAWSSITGFGTKYADISSPTSRDGSGVAFVSITHAADDATLRGSEITTYRTSGLVELPDGDVFDAHGWISYRRLFSSTVTISLLYQGVAILDKEITVNLPSDGTSAVYNGSAYYGGGFYYGFTFAERISKQAFGIAGISSAVQVKVAVTGDEDFQIEEVGLTFASRV